MSSVALVQFSKLDLGVLLPIARQGLDRSLSAPGDAAGAEPPLHHMLCIAAMKSPTLKPTAESCLPYLPLFNAGFIIATDERDVAEILELAGMPSVVVQTVARGVNMAFISGNLSQWKAAVLRGCQLDVSREARQTYNQIFAAFSKVGLASVFEVRKTQQRDTTFLLEHK